MGTSTFALISPEADLDSSVTVGPYAVIHENVRVGKGTIIGAGAIIYPNVSIGERCVVGDHAIVGRLPRVSAISTYGMSGCGGTELHDEVTVGAHAIILAGCVIEHKAFVGDGAFLRENCRIGRFSAVGARVSLEIGVVVGEKTVVHTATFLSEGTSVGNFVFIGGCVRTAAGRTMAYCRRIKVPWESPVFEDCCRVGTGAMIHPRVVVGKEAVVAGGAVVFESVPPGIVVMGNPARPVRRVPKEEYITPEH